MAVDSVPFEVWLEVSTHLSPDDRKRLYSVSHAFFEICMDERYRLLCFQHPKEIAANLDLLIYGPQNAQRVQELHLWPHMLPRLNLDPGTKKLGRVRSLINTPLRNVRHSCCLKKMLQVTSSLTAVNAFSIHSSVERDLPDFIKFSSVIRTGWMAFGSTLRSLTLDISLEGYRHALSKDLTLPNLGDLDISLSMGDVAAEKIAILCNLVAPFINNHDQTLQSFKLSFNDNFDTTPFLLQLRYFHLLRHIAISYPFISTKYAGPDGLQYVLKRHSRTLRSLAFQFKLPKQLYHRVLSWEWEDWSGQEFLHAELPKLESIDIQTELGPDIVKELVVQYLARYNATLTSITIRDRIATFDHMKKLVDAFARCDRLLNLDIRVSVLNPQLLDLLAEKLPNLEGLRLGFEVFSPNFTVEAQTFSSTQEMFAGVLMLKHSYPLWKLSSLAMYTTLGPAKNHDLALSEWAIALAVPGLKTLNSEAILRDGEQWKIW